MEREGRGIGERGDAVEVARARHVEGRVQGVGFRWWTARTAESLGLRGWVRNLPDGAVEVHLAGPRGAVERMEEALRLGPGGARVDRVRDEGTAQDLPEEGFEIR